METFEVSLPLTTGYTLNVLMAAADEQWAMSEVARMLRAVGVNDGEHYSAADVTVKPVSVTPLFRDHWQPNGLSRMTA